MDMDNDLVTLGTHSVRIYTRTIPVRVMARHGNSISALVAERASDATANERHPHTPSNNMFSPRAIVVAISEAVWQPTTLNKANR